MRSTIAALNESNVRYLVVGGVAVVLHGVLRTTLDLDLVLQLERENLERALVALETLGFSPRVPVPIRAFADERLRAQWRREKNMLVFSLWHPQEPGFAVDLFLDEPLPFDEAYARAHHITVDDLEIPVVGLPDLIAMKEQAGRNRDRDDVSALRGLHDEDLR